jgi:PAS domain S-box-containing protein
MNSRDILATTTRINLLPDIPQLTQRPQNEKRVPSTKKAPDSHKIGEDFEQLFNSVYDGTLLTDVTGRICKANGRACQFFDFTQEELTEKNIISLLYDAQPTLLDEIHMTLENDAFILIQAACIRSDGNMFTAEISANRLTLETEHYLCFFIRDTSVRREAEERMRTGYTAIQNAATGIAVADLEGNINYVNAAMCELWGLDQTEDMREKNIQNFLCDE